MGLDYSEQDVINGLGPSRITSTYGLMDASGAGLVDWLAEIGVAGDNNPNASWAEVMAAAGEQPMVIGGRKWCHWVAVRMGSRAAGRPDLDALALMNPAPGYQAVFQLLVPEDWPRLGPFSAVWLLG
jgi:hypothetical protein